MPHCSANAAQSLAYAITCASVDRTNLEELLDDFPEEVGQGGRLSNCGIGSNGGSVAVALLVFSANECIEQQRQPVPSEIPQHLHIPADKKAI